MAGYLPEIQHASEREWALRHAVVYPARAHEAALLRESRLAQPRDDQPIPRFWVRWFRAVGARPVTSSGLGAARPLDGAA